jgi:pyruvate carboxylase
VRVADRAVADTVQRQKKAEDGNADHVAAPLNDLVGSARQTGPHAVSWKVPQV